MPVSPQSTDFYQNSVVRHSPPPVNEQVKASAKSTIKNTRDGVMERNAVTGEDVRISKRDVDFDLRNDNLNRDGYPRTTESHANSGRRRQDHSYAHAASSDTGMTQVAETKLTKSMEVPDQTDNRVVKSDSIQDASEPRDYVSKKPVHNKPREPMKARDRITLKNTRDGLVERNAATGEDSRISKRETEMGLSDVNHDERLNLTQNRRKRKNGKRRRQPSNRADIANDITQPKSFRGNTIPKATVAASALNQAKPKEPTAIPAPSEHGAKLNTSGHGKLRFASDEAAPDVKIKPKQQVLYGDSMTKPTEDMVETTNNNVPAQPPVLPPPIKDSATDRKTSSTTPETAAKGASATDRREPKPQGKPDVPLKTDKQDKLQFTPDETAPDKSAIRYRSKAEKVRRQTERVGNKLDKARKNIPAKRKLRKVSVVDEKSGMVKRKLKFEKTPLSQREHIKGPLLQRPVKVASNALILNAHKKIYEVEHENVSVKAAHRAEMFAEGGGRAALRFKKTAPYRKVAKFEKAAQKKTIKLTYREALADNPKLRSNPFKRFMQKRKIKKDYAKAAREAEKVKKAGSAVSRAGKAVVEAIKRHPAVTTAIVLIALLLFAIMSLVGAFGGMGSGGLGGILTASYLAEDADIDNAETAYTEYETDLQLQIANTEHDWPGYDEYRYDIGNVSHNPYELMAYLTVVYQNFPYDAVASDIQSLFNEQYSLTHTPSVEIRYRTETRHGSYTDADGESHSYSYTVEVPYEWYVLTVTLTARSFTDVAASHLDGEQFAHYALLLQTKGSRQYIGNPFGFNWLPYVTSYYGYRIHPISGVKDLHLGVDIGVAAGTEILSGQDGTVTFAGWSGDYGNVVVIENDKGLVSKYAHCESLLVTQGQTVSMGDAIAKVGSTGASTGAHLHLEVMKDGQYLNPIYFADTGSFSLSTAYGDPGSPMGDGTYAALIAEAERYLGYPYVWGGSSPSTSFDCSGYVSWVLTHSGVKNTGRLGAQGLYNICTPISPSDARPGDLIFFTGTYSTPLPVTHVGIYVGGSPQMMIHCGNPIQYTSIETTYWQNHFYAFGRIN